MTDVLKELRELVTYTIDGNNLRNRAADEIERLRALLVDIDKSDRLEHAWKCGKVIGMLPCDCGCDELQARINAATEEPK